MRATARFPTHDDAGTVLPAGDPPHAATALGQLLASIGRASDAPTVRNAFPATPTPDAIRALLTASERLGLDLDVEPATRRLLEEQTPPFLVVTPDGAARCVEARLGSALFLAGTGEQRVALGDLAKPGVAVLAPRSPVPEPAHAVGERIGARLRPVFWEIAIASVMINLLALATPLFMMTVYNQVIGHGAVRTLDVLAIGMVTLFAFDAALRMLRGYVVSHAGARIDAAIGGDVVQHLLHLPLRQLQALTPGHVVEHLRQIDNLRLFFTGQVPLLWVDLAFVVLFVAVIAVLAPPLAGIVVAAVPLLIFASWYTARRQRKLLAEGFQAAADKASAVGETVHNALTIKALGLEADVARTFDDKLARSAEAGFRAGQLNGTAQTVGLFLQHLVTLVLVYVGAHLILSGDLSVGALIAATILSARALAPLRQLGGAWHHVRAVRDAMATLDKLLAEGADAQQKAGPAPSLEGRLRLDGVGYRYQGHVAALTDVDLEVRPGQVLAILGPPGSGKTTLTKVMLGLLPPQTGRVLVDGFDLRHLPTGALVRQVGFVPQETQLFKGSIAHNIGLGLPEPDFNRIVAAARFTGLHEVIEALPMGYATMLGDGSFNLSTGQAQLLALARALVRNPRLLVFDEATSALDQASEQQLVGRLRPIVRGRTVVMVTHRPALLALADRAVRLDHGRIVDQGSVADVLARGASAPAAPAAE
ncbi:MAG: peptidase domain-containing ABC transporter [Geminicoccaceae bacterium]|nr:MAG: peptidase domain-containing ABC transporter [Geminicoccaceae bacterium]